MIEGKLVNLRAQEMTDLDRAYRWINDREVTEHLSMRYQVSRAAEEEWLQNRTRRMPTFSDINFAIETKEGEHIGNLGFHFAHQEDRNASLGVMIGEKEYWSKGYGTDAIITLLRFGFDEMNLHRVQLSVHDGNDRAKACYRKCGFVEEGRLRQDRFSRGRYIDTIIMGVLRDEFRALGGDQSP